MKLVSIGFMIMSAIQGISSLSIINSWVYMEFSMVAFLMILSASFILERQKETLKFFIVQAFAGMALVFILLGDWVYKTNLYSNLVTMILIMKMGSAPLHSWLLNLSEGMNWESLYYFLTVQKLIPLFFLTNFSSNLLILLSMISWVIGSLSGLLTKSFKKLFIFSSVFFMGILQLTIFEQSGLWMIYLINYSLFSLPLFMVGWEEGSGDFKENLISSVSNVGRFSLWAGLLNVAGVPPFPGFFLKLHFMYSHNMAFLPLLLFLMSSVAMLYMYMGMSLVVLPMKNYELSVKKKMSLFWVSSMLSFTLLYSMLKYMYGCNHVKFWILSLVSMHKYMTLSIINESITMSSLNIFLALSLQSALM